MLGLIRKIFDTNAKEVRRLQEQALTINALEPEIKALTDADLRAKKDEFRMRLDNGATLDDILPEAFAVVREAAWRTIGQRHYDVQLMGGMVLHEGRIAEMKTGEGKTLVATLPVYLNALTGCGVHVVTVNDYLARRDAEWMGRIYRFLGLSVGCIVPGLDFAERRQAYNCDVTYGTNNEFGFDYLRDNMVMHPDQRVQRALHYAIIDEVDNILIDEARTPLIISGQAEESTDHYYRFAQLVPRLRRDVDYTIDEKARQVAITEEGVEKLEQWLGVNMFDEAHFELTHYMQQALRAHALYQKDRDYVVKDGKVIIVDEFTGRLMLGRRYSDGLHQAIEAKEGVRIERESQTLASITFQNYFRMYEKLAGMTGTAETEEAEFRKIYGMDVVVIPTNMPMIRQDHPDLVYKTEQAKFEAIVEEIERLHQQGRPVLVGTISIEKSERLSAMLSRRGIKHQVLNAKYHEKEAEIIAQAGRLGAVTIATNMAGRGTDILLGGNPEFLAKQLLRQEGIPSETEMQAVAGSETDDADVIAAREKYQGLLKQCQEETDREKEQVIQLGGLHVIGSERHESRRIDNQLRGRSGRQGDPGSSRFYVSLEDDLMRMFGSERVSSIMERLGWEDDQPIEHGQITRSIENAQRKVEAFHFDIREQVLKYDDVLNKQREVIYEMRRHVLGGENMRERIREMLDQAIGGMVEDICSEKLHPGEWDRTGLVERLTDLVAADTGLTVDDLQSFNSDDIKRVMLEKAEAAYADREATIGTEQLRELERMILLHVVDTKWMDHLRNMEDLRQGIGLRAYAQQDPLLEYQLESFEMFQDMMHSIRDDALRYLYRVQVRSRDAEAEQAERQKAAQQRLLAARSNRDTAAGPQPRRAGVRVGRNDPCPCGSGKKYKRCCGA
ncbi:MAG: preprotein translocase subunit SecA [Limnochordia bacterium]|jgi:preprotein translocase subunit SecA